MSPLRADDQIIAVPDGHIAAVITYLEMTKRPLPKPAEPAPLSLKKWDNPAPEKYRTLFRRVGAPWLWRSRLLLSDAQLSALFDGDAIALYAVVDRQGIEVGILELDFGRQGACELGFIGLIAALNGHGHGGWLMQQALMLAWRKDVQRVWLHTCTLDHPAALGFYIKSGFTAFRREVEITPDPRSEGLYPPDTAPKIPYIAAQP